MKRYFKVLSIITLVFVSLLALTSCGSQNTEYKKYSICTEHKTDSLCDECGKKEDEHAHEFIDVNGNQECDLCKLVGETVLEKDHNCKKYTDLLCLECGFSKEYHFETFTSENVNSKLKFIHDLAEEEKLAADPEYKKVDYKKVTYLGLFDGNGTLYVEGAKVPAGEYYLIEETSGVPTLEKDDKGFFGPYFAGWYQTKDCRNAEGKLADRLITGFSVDADHIVYAYYIDFGQAVLVAIVCIAIVFSMLLLLWGIVSLFKFIAPKQKQQQVQPKAAPAAKAPVKKAISLADIKDEEMMAAALVATIDYHEETKEDVRVVSIKEIK